MIENIPYFSAFHKPIEKGPAVHFSEKVPIIVFLSAPGR